MRPPEATGDRLDAAPEDARFWQLAQDADIPVAVHIGSFIQGMGTGPAPTFDTLAFMGVA